MMIIHIDLKFYFDYIISKATTWTIPYEDAIYEFVKLNKNWKMTTTRT